MNWFAQSLQSVVTSLNENDLNALTHQYCCNLLTAGVIRQLDALPDSTDGFKPNSMYQWTHREVAAPTTPGRIETSVAWPHANDKRNSPKSREGESRIPKLMSSTPKGRIQLVSSLVTMTEQTPMTLLNGTETDHNKVNELKTKMVKCETVPEMFMLIKSFLNEYSMQSSESSSNSGIFNGSLLSSTETTVFDRSMDSTVFNVMQRPPESPMSVSKTQTTPKSKSFKSRTSPSTPTNTTSRARIRKNLSLDSVSSTSSSPTKPAVNGSGCKRCAQMLLSPARTGAKRMVDKATVMDVEPIVFPKPPELKTTETQTELECEVKDVKKDEGKPAPAPPPPPPMMNIPPPPPMMNIPPPPPPPTLKPPGNFLS